MKKKCLLSFLLFFCLLSKAQHTIKGSFKIINSTDKEKEAFYVSSIENADMEVYRLKNKEVTLHFENGFDCILISAKDLYLIDNKINPSQYNDTTLMEDISLTTFFITDSGLIKAKLSQVGKRATITH